MEDNLPDAQLFSDKIAYDYFKGIIDFLTTGTKLAEYNAQQKKQLAVRAIDFTMIAGQLYKLGPDEVLRRYVLSHERPMILAEAHADLAGGHYLGKPTTHKVLTA